MKGRKHLQSQRLSQRNTSLSTQPYTTTLNAMGYARSTGTMVGSPEQQCLPAMQSSSTRNIAMYRPEKLAPMQKIFSSSRPYH